MQAEVVHLGQNAIWSSCSASRTCTGKAIQSVSPKLTGQDNFPGVAYPGDQGGRGDSSLERAVVGVGKSDADFDAILQRAPGHLLQQGERLLCASV